MMSQHKREAVTRDQVANNKNSVATRKLGHDTELSKVKNSQVATWNCGCDTNAWRQENVVATRVITAGN